MADSELHHGAMRKEDGIGCRAISNKRPYLKPDAEPGASHVAGEGTALGAAEAVGMHDYVEAAAEAAPAASTEMPLVKTYFCDFSAR